MIPALSLIVPCPRLSQEHIDYDLVESTNPAFGKAIVRVNVFRQHRQTVQVGMGMVGVWGSVMGGGGGECEWGSVAWPRWRWPLLPAPWVGAEVPSTRV